MKQNYGCVPFWLSPLSHFGYPLSQNGYLTIHYSIHYIHTQQAWVFNRNGGLLRNPPGASRQAQQRSTLRVDSSLAALARAA